MPTVVMSDSTTLF